MSDLDTKFRERYEVREDGCWEWLPAPGHPYGCFWAGPTPTSAHRWAYEHFVGPIPDGLTIDHLCGFTRCVNPEHLEPVTQAENLRRYHQRTTHCIAGSVAASCNESGTAPTSARSAARSGRPTVSGTWLRME